MKKRFWEIDFFRGIAIILMVIFHALWDLNYFWNLGWDFNSGFLNFFQIFIASLFLFLVGVSLYVSSWNSEFKKYFRRGVRILGFAFIITLVTYLIDSEVFILFGILHLIGVSILLAYFFRKFYWWNLVFGICFVIFGVILYSVNFSNNWFLIFGFVRFDYFYLDYYPIFPWFGIVLIGMFLGRKFYFEGRRCFVFFDGFSRFKGFSWVEFLGGDSLLIYMIHQVVLFGGFWIIRSLV